MSFKTSSSFDPAELFEPRLFENAAGETMPYRLLPPLRVEPQKQYPLVLCLHGMGERGDDNLRQLTHVIPAFAGPEVRERFPAWIVAPQCPADEQWAGINRNGGGQVRATEISRPLRLCLEAISSLEKKGAVDSLRLYVIGLSMGGFGTWDLIARYPDIFAAAVPICGGGDERMAPFLGKMPIWAFHGAMDDVVPAENTRRMIQAIQAAGGNPRYTEYPDAGHNSWDPAMREPELLPWLFSCALSR